MRPFTSLPRRGVFEALAAGVLFTVTACGGSALDPKYVRAANEAVSGNSGGGGTGAGPLTPTGQDPVTGAPVDPAAPVDPGSGTGTGTGTGGGPVTTGNAGGAGGGGGTAPLPGTRAASCAGFKNGPGITDKVIKIGNSSDISGPVPGLFRAPQTATRAYVAYFNRTSSICGRKLELITLDSRTDAGADQQSTQKLCEQVFAAVGSLSAFDSGGAQTAQGCGLPDVRATATTAQRNRCTTCFGAQATGANEYSNGIPDFFVKNYPEASQKAAFLYLNAGASAENGKTQIAVETKRGMKFLYTSPIDVADFNYGPYVQQMKSKGVEYVQFIGGYQQAVRLAQAMQSGDFKPQVRHFDQTTDDPGYLKSGGSAVEGNITSLTYKPLYESQPELNLYKQWLQQVAPGESPNAFGMYGWSASKLFVEQALALGGKLTRASLVASLTKVKGWTGGGMHGPMDVGGKHTADCVRFQVVKNGKFVSIGGTRFLCTGITKIG